MTRISDRYSTTGGETGMVERWNIIVSLEQYTHDRRNGSLQRFQLPLLLRHAAWAVDCFCETF